MRTAELRRWPAAQRPPLRADRAGQLPDPRGARAPRSGADAGELQDAPGHAIPGVAAQHGFASRVPEARPQLRIARQAIERIGQCRRSPGGNRIGTSSASTGRSSCSTTSLATTGSPEAMYSSTLSGEAYEACDTA